MNEREALKLAMAQPEQEPEFVTHNVDKPYDWSEWVCPNPSGYLMKCCDCGLVHEAEFGVVRYKSETEREDCDMVDDPNLQAVFRMRRSEKWSPEDTAHRAGGLPMAQPEQKEQLLFEIDGEMLTASQMMGVELFNFQQATGCDTAAEFLEQPEQEPVAWMRHDGARVTTAADRKNYPDYETRYSVPLYTAPPQREWVGLTKEEVEDIEVTWEATSEWSTFGHAVRYIEAALKEKNT